MIILASKSPRRQVLLEQIGLSFQLITTEIDEAVFLNEPAVDYVKRMAQTKAQTAFIHHKANLDSQSIILAADTIVSIGGGILGKPQDYADFKVMMERLSGNTHQVYSSIVLMNKNKTVEKLNISFVTFSDLSDTFIKSYWDSHEPCDKAGGYAVQGMMARFIQSIEGSYSGIMGLPLYELSQALEEMGYN